MNHEEIIALARCLQAKITARSARLELDDAVNAAVDLGLSTRTIARYAGLEFSTIARRARLRGEPTVKGA